MDRLSNGRISTGHNSTYKKLAVQWLNEALCFVSSSVLADSFVLRIPQRFIPPNVGGQFKERLTLTNNNDVTFMKWVLTLWNYIKTDSRQFLVNLIAIITFVSTLGKNIFNEVYFFLIKTKSKPHLSYDNKSILIKIPIQYKDGREFNIFEIDILKYYHKKGLFFRKTTQYDSNRLKIKTNTLNQTIGLHFFDYEISLVDIINFKLNGKIFIDVSFKQLNSNPINKTYNLSDVVKNNKQIFKLIINRQKELNDDNRKSNLNEEQKNILRRKIDPEFEKRDEE